MVLKLPDEKKDKDGDGGFFLRTDVRETSGVTAVPTIGDFTNANHAHANAEGGGQLDHTSAFSAGAGTNTHAQIDTHIADGTKHFVEGSIDHTNILNIGTNTHTQVDTHLAASAPHSGHVDTTGDESISGIKTFSSFPISPSSAPSTDYQFANKKYVDDTAVSGGVSYNTDDFILIGTTLNLKNKTSYWSCGGANFQPQGAASGNHPTYDPTTDIAAYSIADADEMVAEVKLPHGAIITGAVTYGSDSSDVWTLYRGAISGGSITTLATAVFNTEDTTISNATIDNSTYKYWIGTSTITGVADIDGAKITYTTDYD